MDEADIEYTLLNKKECMLYQIPPATATGYKADDWKECMWRGRMLVTAKSNDLFIKFVHVSGDKIGDSLVEMCVKDGDCDKFVERTQDSSRYFALRVVDGAKKTSIGLGFEDRNDSFDFISCLQDFKNRNVVEKADPIPTKDFSLKEGQKITVNLKGLKSKPKKDQSASGGGGALGGFLPAPPGGNSRKLDQPSLGAPTIAPPSATTGTPFIASPPALAPAASNHDDDDFFSGFSGFQSATVAPAAPATSFNGAFQSAPLQATAVNVGAPLQSVPVQLPPASSGSPLVAFGGLDFNMNTSTEPSGAVGAATQPAPVQATFVSAPPAAPAAGAAFDPFAQFPLSASAAPPLQPAAPLVATNVVAHPPAAGGPQPQKDGSNDPFDIFKM